MAKDFKMTTQFRGYLSRADITKVKAGYLVNGSQNVLSTDKGTISAGGQYVIYGAANSATDPIEASYDWNTHSAVERNLRAYSDELEVDIGGTWTRVLNGWASVDFQFAEYWDTNEGEDILLFVNGDGSVYSWSGGLAVISAVTANTIKKTGTATWAEARFISNGTDYDKKVVINGTTYTYTGGESTTTLTGVTGDPSGEAVGSNVIQKPTTHANIPAANFNADRIGVLDNHVWYGSTQNRQVYVSKQNDFNNVTFASPRAVGEGALLTLDGVVVGFIAGEEAMYITAGKNQWYKSKLTLSADLTAEDLSIDRFKTSTQGGAKSQNLIHKVKNAIVFISNEPTMDSLGDIEDIPSPQQKPLSHDIKDDFDAADWDNGDSIYYKGKSYITIPDDGKVLIYDWNKRQWEAPQLMYIRKFAIIGGLLYGHSSKRPETYRLFSGYNANGGLINCVAKFSYQNYGDREALKCFDEFYNEGYIHLATDLTLELNYDFEGSKGKEEYTIDGGDTTILFRYTSNIAIGIDKIGINGMGGTGITATAVPKFRQISEMAKIDFHELQVVYKCNQLNARFELIGFGPLLQKSPAKATGIKK